MTKNASYRGLRYIFDTAGLCKTLRKELQKDPVDCIIIDAFPDIYDGDMNAVNRVRTFLQVFSDLAHEYGCLIIFLHHTGKRTEGLIPSKDNLLGSQGFEGKMRMVAELRRDPNDPSTRHLCIVKGNYISQDYKNASFALRFDPETLLFHNTGRRVEFKHLVKRDLVENEDEKRAHDRMIALHLEGKSSRQIADKLREENLPWGKSTVANRVAAFNKSRPDVQDPIVYMDGGQPDDEPVVEKTNSEMDDEQPFDD